ncbi:hypothetical protein [Desulfovibrio inopinatus]|uniref:hypothetical protein n=1 Tax=Desulfovibrio inopinatus TaxID=102109 RepID=UPI0003FFC4F2|nr:hypothetical protein [Desulfovibrio inopinatus]
MTKISTAMENLASAVAYAEMGCRDEALRLVDLLSPIRKSTHPKIILASNGLYFSDSALHYAAGLVERMHCDVLTLSVEIPPGNISKAVNEAGTTEPVAALQRMIQWKEAICLHQIVHDGLCQAIQEYCRVVRDVRFAVIQAQENEIPHCELPIPVFLVHA